jgi:exopolysaccharide production protein ExoQ
MKTLAIPPEPLHAPSARAPWLTSFLLQLAVFDSLVSLNPAAAEDSGLSRQLLWGMLGVLALGYLLLRRLADRELRYSFGGWPVALLLLYTGASFCWSVSPLATLKRDILLVFLVAVCALSAGAPVDDWRRERFSTLLAPPILWLIGLSLVLTVVAPHRAWSEVGWAGITAGKNTSGQLMALTVLLVWYGVFHQALLDRPWRRVFALLAALGLLFATMSSTALLAVMLAIAITELVTIKLAMRRLASWQIAVASGGLIVAVLLYFAFLLELLPTASTLYSQLLGAMGKSETFTGRTAIWNLVLGESRYHNTWIGGGYGGFWVGRTGVSSYAIVGNNLYPGQAHNGYIDIYNDLGILGLVLLAVFLSVALYRAGRLVALGHPEGKMHLCIPLMCVFLNLGESTFFRSTSFMNIVFLASVIRSAALLRHTIIARSTKPVESTA